MLKEKHKFIINSSGGKGKDTLIDFIKEKYMVMNISTVDLPKKAAEYAGWDGGKTEKDRKFLSDLTILFYEYNDTPYTYVKENLDKFNRWLYHQIMFVHCREIVNIERFKKDFGFKSIMVRNPNVEDITSNMADADASRTDYDYDYYIDNDGTLEDLKVKVGEFLEGLEKEENERTI
jgi:hypothetical protein